jgi:O-6-methylguanine DNA methyltransferase
MAPGLSLIPHQDEPCLWYGYHGTPLGHLFIAVGADSLVSLQFLTTAGDAGDRRQVTPETCQRALGDRWPKARLELAPDMTQPLGDRLFRPPSLGDRPLRLQVTGTPFQQQVWQALLAIPYGGRVTYGDLAIALNKPKAARAIGSAVGRNTIAYFIPCHRVVRANGDLGDYRWGRDRKAALLRWEAEHR